MEEIVTEPSAEQNPEEGEAPGEGEITPVTDPAEEPAPETTEEPSEEIVEEPEAPAEEIVEEPAIEDENVVDDVINDDPVEKTFKVTIANYRTILDDVTFGGITSATAGTTVEGLESDGTFEIKTTAETVSVTLPLTPKTNAVIENVKIGDGEEQDGTVSDAKPYTGNITGDTTVTITTAPAYKLTVKNAESPNAATIKTYTTADDGKVTPADLESAEKTKKPSADLEFSVVPKDGTTVTVSYFADGGLDETVLEPSVKDDPEDPATTNKKQINFYTIKKTDIDSLNELEIVVKAETTKEVTFEPNNDVVVKLYDSEATGTDKYTKDYSAADKPKVDAGQTIKFKATAAENSIMKISKVIVMETTPAVTAAETEDAKKPLAEIEANTTGEYEVTITKDSTISFETVLAEGKYKTLKFTLTGEDGSATMALTSLTEKTTGDAPATPKTDAGAMMAVLNVGNPENAFEAATGTDATGVAVEPGVEYWIPSTVDKITLAMKTADGFEFKSVTGETIGSDNKTAVTKTNVTYTNIGTIAVETEASENAAASYFKFVKPDAVATSHIAVAMSTGVALTTGDSAADDVYMVPANTKLATVTLTVDEGYDIPKATVEGWGTSLGGALAGTIKGVVGADKKTTYTINLLATQLSNAANAANIVKINDEKLANAAMKQFTLTDENASALYDIDVPATVNDGYGITPDSKFPAAGDATLGASYIPYNAKLVAKVAIKTDKKSKYLLKSVSYKMGDGDYVSCTPDVDESGVSFAKIEIANVTGDVKVKVEVTENYTFNVKGVTAADKVTSDLLKSGETLYTVEQTGKYIITTDPETDSVDDKLTADIMEGTTVLGRGRKIAVTNDSDETTNTLQIWMQKAWAGKDLTVIVKKDGVQIGSPILLFVKKGRTSIVVNDGKALSANVANNARFDITTDGEPLDDSNAEIVVTKVGDAPEAFVTLLSKALRLDDGKLVYDAQTGTQHADVAKVVQASGTGETAVAASSTPYQAKVVIKDSDDSINVKSKAVIMTLNPVLDTTKAPTLTVKDTSDVSIDVVVGMDGVNVPDDVDDELYYEITATPDNETAEDKTNNIEAKTRPEKLLATVPVKTESMNGSSQKVTINVAKSDVKLGEVGAGWGYTLKAKAVYKVDESNLDNSKEATTTASTKDTYFASTLKLKKDGKHTPKAVSTVYSGQKSEDGLYVATLDWTDKKFTPYKIAHATVKDLNGNIDAVVNEKDELIIRSVPSWETTGKHVLQVTAYADETNGHEMYAARATINVTVVRGIESIWLTPAQTQVALPSGKNTVSVKATTYFNSSDNKTNKPKSAKATYEVLDWEGKTPTGVTIDKKGTVKITSAFPFSERYTERNKIYVKVSAADYAENTKNNVSSDTKKPTAVITIKNEAVDLTNVVIAKTSSDSKTVDILAKAGNSKPVEISALQLNGAEVVALRETAKDSYTKKEWDALKEAAYSNKAISYTPVYGKGKIAYVSGGQVNVLKTGSVTINAAANDGSKNGKKSKAAIKLKVTATAIDSSAALKISYAEASGKAPGVAVDVSKTEIADKTETKGNFKVSGAAKLIVEPYFAAVDKDGKFKQYDKAAGFEDYKITVTGAKDVTSSYYGDGTQKTYITTAKETTLTLTTGKGKTARKYTYKLTNTAFKDNKPKITVVGTLYTDTDADTQEISLKVLNGKENFQAGTKVKLEADRTVKNPATFLEAALAKSVVEVVDGNTAKVVFNKDYEYASDWYSGFNAGSYKMIATVGSGTTFAATAAPVNVTIKVAKRKAFTFKPATSYTINPQVDGGAVLTGKDNVKGAYTVNFATLENANVNGKSNKFTHYFEINNEATTGRQTLVLRTSDPEVQKLIYEPITDKDGKVTGYNTEKLLDELKLSEIKKEDLTGYVKYTAVANDKYYSPSELKEQYVKITVKFSAQKKDKVAKAAQKYVADTANIKVGTTTTKVNVKVNGQYVNVAGVVLDDSKAKNNAAELTAVTAEGGQIKVTAAATLDPTNKKGYSTNVIILPATSIYAGMLKTGTSADDVAANKALIEKYGVAVKITVKAVAAADWKETMATPAPENKKPDGNQGGGGQGGGETDDKTAADAKKFLEKKTDWAQKAVMADSSNLAANDELVGQLKTEVETALRDAGYTADVTFGGTNGNLRLKDGDNTKATVEFVVTVGGEKENVTVNN